MSAGLKLVEGHRMVPQPPGVAVWDIDPFAAEVLGHLESYFAELRRRGAFVYLSRYAMLACGRYPETKEVFSDWERFVSSRGVGLTDFKLAEPWRPPSIVLEVDPPYHTTTRRVIMRALSARAIANLRDRFQRVAETLVDELLARKTFDAVPDLAERFPVSVFPQAVGLKEIDGRKLLDYGAMVFNALGPDNELRRHWLAKAPQVVPWIMEQCRRERLEPDGIGADIYRAVDLGEINDNEAGMLVRSLLSAGLDTTATGLGNTLWCLANYPDAFEKLRGNIALARAVFDEALRLTSPVHTFCRTANLDTEVSGVQVSRDTKILCVLGAANLDTQYWRDADQFDVNRKGHLAFGIGIHGCVGQVVARAEVEAVLTALAARVSRIELAGEARWQTGHAVHALRSLPLRLYG